MYSYEDRIRAVALYITLGKRVRATIRQWGYPRNWQSTTIEQFIQAVDSYIRWYNERRIKISLGSLSPIEYRESLGLAA
jgi:transposase InsO family protein